MQIAHNLKVSEEQRIFLRDVLRLVITEREHSIDNIDRGDGGFRNTRDIFLDQIRDAVVLTTMLDDVAKPVDDIPF